MFWNAFHVVSVCCLKYIVYDRQPTIVPMAREPVQTKTNLPNVEFGKGNSRELPERISWIQTQQDEFRSIAFTNRRLVVSVRLCPFLTKSSPKTKPHSNCQRQETSYPFQMPRKFVPTLAPHLLFNFCSFECFFVSRPLCGNCHLFFLKHFICAQTRTKTNEQRNVVQLIQTCQHIRTHMFSMSWLFRRLYSNYFVWYRLFGVVVWIQRFVCFCVQS